ncbi:MAG: hypothetical protein A2Z25_13275 [Planctomycetes bacterium RBG_16_55_9]|nr:MAG: hypothetical protein A2Z25_13275 [Planctomycetes bacterium RBG_16_55_9]
MKTSKNIVRFSAIAVVLFVTTGMANERIIYVDDDAAGANDGSKWEDAFKHLQDALNAASCECEIWVAQGVYKPDLGRGITRGDQRATFQLKNGVTIKGGYAGLGEPDLDARDIETYITILSGDLGGNDIPVGDPLDLLTDTTRTDNSLQVVIGIENDTTAVLDGFVVTSGHCVDWPGGGGMYNYRGSPTITNCTFIANSTLENGGGVYNHALSSPTFTDCVFKANGSFNHGGGMLNVESSNPTLTRCEFVANGVMKDGGGLYNMHNSHPKIMKCTFEGNWAGKQGGGMSGFMEDDLTLTECIFDDNYAKERGGGIATGANVVLINCTFIHNSAYSGGGINAKGILANCLFIANHAKDEAGGLLIGAGDTTLMNCAFIGNSTDVYGGAVCSTPWGPPDYTFTFINCIFNSNSGAEGGGLFFGGHYGHMKLTNCILWANQDNDGVAASAQIHGNRAEATYCCIQGWTEALGRTTNISLDPMFLRDPDDGGDGWGDDPATPNIDEGLNDDFGNLHLWPGSPCIDAGDNTAVPLDTEDLDGDGNTAEKIPVDFDGNPRFIDVPPPGGRGVGEPPQYNEIVDLGVYESTGVINVLASDPIPSDGAVHESTSATLQWKPGETAVSHDVYFGKNFGNVNNANTSNKTGIYRGRQTETSYVTEELDRGQTYYWRIDEVEPDGTTIHKGNIWSFTVVNEITVEYQVSSSEDDGYVLGDASQHLDTNYLRVGSYSLGEVRYYTSGMVFRGVNVPQGAEIVRAHLRIRSYDSRLTGIVYGQLQAEATDNAGAFGGFHQIASVPKTNAAVNWDHVEPWSADEWYESLDIAKVVQEVVNRGGWSANNALAILYSTRSEGGYRNFSSFDRGNDSAPVLEITYVP